MKNPCVQLKIWSCTDVMFSKLDDKVLIACSGGISDGCLRYKKAGQHGFHI
jgi:hypothetical protein